MFHWSLPTAFTQTQLPQHIRQWLLFPGSMTGQLKWIGQGLERAFRINVIKEHLELLKDWAYEAHYFNSRYVYVREIEIYLGGSLLIYARSSIPKNAPSHFKQRFRGLGRRPLGELLFNSREITRGKFELIKNPGLITPEGSSFPWARRSLFLDPVPFLSLTEYFSNDFPWFHTIRGPIVHAD